MKKGSFDLTGKAIDCRQLPEMGDAGKEIFRALKAACNGFDNPEYAEFESISSWGFLVIDDGEYANAVKEHAHPVTSRLQPIAVLGQARIDAAKDGATLVFEGDTVPDGARVEYYFGVTIGPEKLRVRGYAVEGDMDVIAYKLIEEKKPSTQSPFRVTSVTHFNRALSEQEIIEITKPSMLENCRCVTVEISGFKAKPRYSVSIESRVLSEKMGLGQPTLSMDFDKDYFKFHETYDELRDAHLELVRENMLLVKENEALAQRIKNLHRAINDAKACLDE